ncbi:MAG: TetR/AcrR family transcriptional regulator [Wenzhouxiangella sp.]
MNQSPPATRDRLIAEMGIALQRRGLHGVGLTELLQAANAPKGVLYHHFPGGKTELAVVAIEDALDRVVRSLGQLLSQSPDPIQGLGLWLDAACDRLQKSGFQDGCPLAAVALESKPDDVHLRSALAEAFRAIRNLLAESFVQAGLAEDESASLAALVIATYEGALIQARVAGNGEPMKQGTKLLLTLISHRLSSPNDP